MAGRLRFLPCLLSLCLLFPQLLSGQSPSVPESSESAQEVLVSVDFLRQLRSDLENSNSLIETYRQKVSELQVESLQLNEALNELHSRSMSLENLIESQKNKLDETEKALNDLTSYSMTLETEKTLLIAGLVVVSVGLVLALVF